MAPVLEKKRKRAPTPEELGLVPVEEPPPPAPPPAPWTNKRKPAPTPKDLGLIPVNDNEADQPEPQPAPPPPPTGQPTPQDLGLVDPDKDLAPSDGTWQDLWDWSSRQLDTAGDTATWALDGFRDALGFDDPPEPFTQDTTRRVPRKDMTDTPVGVAWLLDWLVPDAAYDFVTSKRTWNNLEVGADKAMAGFVIPLVRGGVKVGKTVNQFLEDDLGIDFDTKHASDDPDGFWNDTLAWMKEDIAMFGRKVQKNQLPADERGWLDALVETIPSIPPMLVAYGASTFLTRSPMAGFASVDGLISWGNDDSEDKIAFAVVKGAILGKTLEWLNVLSRPLRIPPLALAGSGMAWAEGADLPDIIAGGIVFPILGALPKSGPMNVRYFKEHGVLPDLRDLGGHLRDLFYGGNSSQAAADVKQTAWALKQVRAKHNVEATEEQMRWQDDLAEARKPREGDTPTDVDSRVAEANRAHEQRMEEYSQRHYDEELPHRQANDHAQRRHDRVQHPWRMSWTEAPYMRRLHMHERDIAVEHTRGAEIIKKAEEDANERARQGQERAEEIRAQAAEEADPVARRRLEQLADFVEDESLRITFETRSSAEDIAEFRVELAEAEATRWRFELAEVVSRRHTAQGRKMVQLAAERELEDAYRAGLRKVTRANRRARDLLNKGDQVVERTRARLRRDGVTEENPETNGVWTREMAKAEEIRDAYREAAAFELYSSQSSADFRISFATAAHDAAYNPTPKTGLVDWILRLLGLRKPKPTDAEPKETTPEEAKADAPEGWDKPPEKDPYNLPPNFEARYKALLQHSQKDPKLGAIQDRVDHALQMITDPKDVFPAINYLAQQAGYDPPSRRGKQTARARRDLAKRLGMTEEEFLNSPHGRAFSDFEIEAIIMMLDRQWARVQRSYEIWRKTGSNNAFMAYQAELYRFMMIWERLRGVAAESGRALRMFRDIKGKYGSVGKPMTDLDYKMIMSGDMASAGRMINSRANGRWFDMLIEYYINSLLSGPQTAMVNILSGISMIAWKSTLQPAIAAGVGLTRYAFHRLIGRHLQFAFRPIYRGLIRMFGSKEANKKLDIKIENERWMPYGTETMVAHQHRIRLGEVGARVRGVMEGIFYAIPQFFKTLFLGDRFLGEATYGKGMGEFIPWWLGGGIIRIPGKILQAIDDFFKVIMYRSALRGHAYRQAMAEYNYTSQGWKELRGRRDRYRELVKRPDGFIQQMAKKEALEATFQNDLAPEWAGVPGFVARTPALRILVPFTRTLLNSLEFVLSGTPAFFLFRRARDAVMGRYGRAQQDMAIAHMIMVTGGASAIFLWALGDNVAPPYPKDEKGRTIQGINDVPPLSVRIPGTDKWIQLNRIDPIGAIIAMGASAAQTYKIAVGRGDEKSAEKAWSIFFASIFSMVADRSGFRGLMDFFEAFQGGTSNNDYKAWERWGNKTLATIAVPQAVAGWARTQDPVIRRAETLLDNIYARLPGYRDTLPPVRNVFGDQVIGYDSYGSNDALDYTMPIYWGKKSEDAASNLLIDLFKIYNWAPGGLDRKIAGRELTPEQYDYYQVQAGKYTYHGISTLANSPEWKRAQSLDTEAKALRKQINKLEDTRAGQTPEGKKRLKELKARYKTVSDELSKLRYALLQKAKDIVSGSRKRARNDLTGTSDGKIPGRFPGFWQQPKLKDDAANSGEVPDYTPEWLDMLFNSEDENEDWDASEAKASDEHGQEDEDPAATAARKRDADLRAKHAAWRKRVEEIQAINAQRMQQGLPPLPIPPNPTN